MPLLRSKPKLGYCGLTIVLSNPSRFDIDNRRLLSATGGQMLDDYCLRPEFNSMQCDIRLVEETDALLPGTKCVLLLGEAAAHKFLSETRSSTLSMIRGGLYNYNGIPAICSFLPQDSVDIKNYEKTHNSQSADYSPDDSVSNSDEDEGDVKAFGFTKRANYCFWLRADIRKCKSILRISQNSLDRRDSSNQKMDSNATTHVGPIYVVYPGHEEVIKALTGIKGQHLYFDIETDREQQNLQCFAFSFDGITIYSVPILDYTYRPAYKDVAKIMRALAIAIRDNIVVAHNGAAFDFYVLAYKYRIPIDKTYDTMLAMHRCFPDIEKSLGHCVSYWTTEKFHKDEDSSGYHTENQMRDRLKYCAKDVHTMFLVKQAIDAYARTIPGLQRSIDDAMSCIKPYLIATLQGIRIDETEVNKKCLENDRLMLQYNRFIELLIGPLGMNRIREGKKMSMLPGSPKQCMKYFYDLLGYPEKKNPSTGERSLGKNQLYQLALTYDNPVIMLICLYRATQKETSRLRFTPWVPRNEIHKNTDSKAGAMDTENISVQYSISLEQQTKI